MPRENSISDEADNRSLTPDMPGQEHPSPTSGFFRDTPKLSPTSPISNTQTAQQNAHPPVNPSPGDRFRATVRKIMRLHRTSSWIATRGVGAEPGVDPRHESATLAYGHIRENCVIEVCDFSSVRSSFSRMTNKEFIDLMNNPQASSKEPWVKVRWINIGGISWDVISVLGLKYSMFYIRMLRIINPTFGYSLDLHPLALEDVLHSTSRKRSKVDYYSRHLFLCILCHSLGQDDEFKPSIIPHTWTNLPRSASPASFDEKDKQGDKEFASSEGHDRTLYMGSSGFTLKKTLKHFFDDIEKGPPEAPRWSRLGAIQKAAVRA